MEPRNVMIRYTHKPGKYLASCEKDCKDSFDRFAYRMAIRQGATVQIGIVVAEPVIDN